MNQIEENIVNSFRLAKNDIIWLQEAMTVISQNQERIMELMNDTRDKENMLYQRMKVGKNIVIKRHPRTKKFFVASDKGKKIHESNCPFAKNIKPKRKIVFKSKTKALNQGFKPCECLKKI